MLSRPWLGNVSAASADPLSAHKLSVRFIGLFLVLELATRQNRVDPREVEASDATTEIAGPQEKHHIGAVDRAVIDAPGRPRRLLTPCQTWIARCEAAWVR